MAAPNWTWWRHDMETFATLITGPWWGESSGDQWIATQKGQKSVALMFSFSILEQEVEQAV